MNTTSAPTRAAMWAGLALAVLASVAGCALYRMEQDLPEPYAEFLSDVRYLITSFERKAFLTTPDSRKDAFIEEFWEVRDPDPDTVDNEVRSEYYARKDQANETFRTEGIPGWLTDRGRIYILFGPPDEQRILTPTETGGKNCREIWYYGGFPIQFVAQLCLGKYVQETFDLTPIGDRSLNQPPARSGPGGRPGDPRRDPGPATGSSRGARPTLDFSAEVRTTDRRADRVEGLLHIEIPVRTIWFKAEGGRFLTTFSVSLKVRDSEKGLVLEKTDSAGMNIPEEELRILFDGVHVIEIPIVVDGAEAAARLAAGPATVEIRVTNQTGSEDVRRTVEWS